MLITVISFIILKKNKKYRELKMNKSIVIIGVAIAFLLSGCSSTSNIVEEQKVATQRNDLFNAAQNAVKKLTERLKRAEKDNLIYFANDLYKDVLDEMKDVNSEFDGIRFSPQDIDQGKSNKIQTYILKTNNLLNQAYLVKATSEKVLVETNTQMKRLNKLSIKNHYPRSYKQITKKIDNMVDDIADGDLEDAQNDQAELLLELYALEVKVVKKIELASLINSITAFKKSRAERLAPISLQKAIATKEAAEGTINSNPRAVLAIKDAVSKAAFEIAHVEHIILEIKKLSSLNNKQYERYILENENMLAKVYSALDMIDQRNKPITEQVDSTQRQASDVQKKYSQKLIELADLSKTLIQKEQIIKELEQKLVNANELEQQIITRKLTSHAENLKEQNAQSLLELEHKKTLLDNERKLLNANKKLSVAQNKILQLNNELQAIEKIKKVANAPQPKVIDVPTLKTKVLEIVPAKTKT